MMFLVQKTLSLKALNIKGTIFKKLKSLPHLNSCFYMNASHKTSSCLNKSRICCIKSVRRINVMSKLLGTIVPFKLSDIGEGIVEVTVKEWFVKPGDKISQFDNICEVQSDKASVSITSRYDGIVKKLYYNVDDIAKVGQALVDIELDSEENRDEESSESDEETNNFDSNSCISNDLFANIRSKALTTPAVRRIAKENNINLQDVKGTGKDGRILKEDVLAFIQGKETPAELKQPPASPDKLPPPCEKKFSQPLYQYNGKDRRQDITGFKKAMVKSMTSSWSIPHFSYCDEINITELVKFKDEMNKISQSSGVKLTYMPFFVKAASLALLKYPELNSHVDKNCQYITIKAAHNIAIAMDTQSGLVVPNIKNVQQLGVIDIGREINRLQTLGATNKLGLDDLKDGTFTLSNIGSIGGTYAKPIILSPQVIIGALGKIQVLPRFDEKKNVIEAHVFNVSWSADHRIIDGATVARFSNLWKEYLNSPKLLLQL